jgi:endothelin-converting enzyme
MAPYSTHIDGLAELCTTPACVHIASEILWNLAPNYTEIDPCADFDQRKYNFFLRAITSDF